jgi:phage major head subunit gpT-like protein
MSAQGLGSRAITGEYYAALERDAGASWVGLVSNLFDSNQGTETYKWLGQVPMMRQWLGGRLARTFREQGISIENLHYEATMEVLLSELRRDKTGQIMIRVQEFAQAVNAHWAKLLTAALVAAESTNCYDGQYFFDTDHSEHDSGTQDNDVTFAAATGTTPTAGEMSDAIMAAATKIIGYKDDQGEPANENAREFLVMVPPSTMGQAAAALGSTVLVDSATAVRSNTIMAAGSLGGYMFRLAVNARLTDGAKMYLFRTDAPTKALIRQQETEPTLEAIAEGSEEEKLNKRHLYMVDSWRNVGYGLWSRACLTTFT